MPRLRYFLSLGLLLLCGALALGLAGCGDNGRLSYATETDEPAFTEGKALLRAGRKQEALSSFLKVIERRGDDAPESHLEAGLLYYSHISDPIAAIYHFKQYLALRPNSPQAPLVRQRIDAAIREFARTLPAQPLENAGQRVDHNAALDKLKLENELLKQQVADLKAGREPAPDPAEVPAAGAATSPAASAPGGKLALNFDPMPVVHTRSPQARTEPIKPAAAPARNGGAKTVTPAKAPATGESPPGHAARKHTVKPGDTLSKLAQQYYGNRAKWRDIYNANRKVMRNEGDLHTGMELVIP